jgi:hypothetical protein
MRIYWRYVKDDLPPFEEIYLHSPEGLLLTFVSYDSDGDWRLDTTLEFSRKDAVENRSVYQLHSRSLQAHVFPRHKALEALSVGRTARSATQWLTEPSELSSLNSSRFECPEYVAAVETVGNLACARHPGQKPLVF